MAQLSLEITEGADAGRLIPLEDTLSIGRSPDNIFTLDDDQVSRHHARVNVEGGTTVIEDMGSRNGTFVNEQAISGRRQLTEGDRVRIGVTVMAVQAAHAQVSAVHSAPQITQLGAEVLKPADPAELAPVPYQPEIAQTPSLRAEEGEPGYVGSAVGRIALGEQPDAGGDKLAALVDVRVKSQTNTAAIGFLSVVGLAVAIYFGVR